MGARKSEFVFAEWVPMEDRPMGGRHAPIAVATRPTHVWMVFPEGAVPSPDVKPTHKRMIHGRTARLEDEGHDWSWRGGLLRYNGVAGPTWLYLEYE